MADTAFDKINEAKANMDHIYDQPDPRAYFRELKELDYRIPQSAKPVFQTLLNQLHEDSGETVHALDLGCSYGVNAALLKYDLTMPQLYDRWADPDLSGATPQEVVATDRQFFDRLDNAVPTEIIGLDPAEQAVNYAKTVGLIDHGLALNLETDPLPSMDAEKLESIDLMMSTGCVGYMTERSFEEIMPAVSEGRSPWIANFVLRMFQFDAIEETLAERGYVTERLESRTFFQRKFASVEEQAHAVEQVEARMIDTTGEEADGNLVAEFYLSRPAGEAAALPLAELIAAEREGARSTTP
jgi:hypothetical protein